LNISSLKHDLNRERLSTLWLTTATHSSQCLEAFHCSSAVSGWSIATWANGRHSLNQLIVVDNVHKLFNLISAVHNIRYLLGFPPNAQ